MIRPFTCVCLILAAGSGLYLYQVKQRAFALDAELRGTFHDIDMARERTRMLRADWALMNDPERLQALASQYLQLQPMAPSQLMTMDQLAATLPAPIPPGTAPAAPSDATPPGASTPGAPAPDAGKMAPAIDPTHGMPMAEATPRVLPHTRPTPEVALLQPVPAAQVDAPAASAVAAAAPPIAAPSVAVPPPPSFAAAAPAPVFTPEPTTPGPAATQPQAPPPDAIAIAPPPKVEPAPAPKPAHHWARHAVPTPAMQPWLADANGGATAKARRWHHRTAPSAAPPPAQVYAANEPARLPDPTPRITPPAATVMYSPASGSSLGMAASAALAPPRPLYSTSQ
jgi:hypothetical protein